MRANYLAVLLACLVASANGNNISVSNISLENLNTTNQTVMIQFTLGWENSWRISTGPSNWDAAWVFVKFRANSGAWTHANLSSSPGVAGGVVKVSSDEVGAMIYRNSDGTGTVTYSNIQIQWDYGENGVSEVDILDVQVFAIEMVYVTPGAFYVGSGGTETNTFYEGGTPNTIFQVKSENAITIDNTSGNLYYQNDNAYAGDNLGPIPADFPKGYQGFYCMKYEVSESQWLGFFNSLTTTQKLNHDLTDSNHKNLNGTSSRNTITWAQGSSDAVSAAPNRGVGYLSKADINAYLDWSGLRPMTELEYEKICRGPIIPTVEEFAWGNADISASSYMLVNDGQADAYISNAATGTGNATYSLTNNSGPLRVGIFPASAQTSNREESGGSYFGIMDLSGNLWESCVSVGNAQGRSYTGLHGDGKLDASGDSDVSFWPINSTGLGYGQRGGGFGDSSNALRTSDRSFAISNIVGAFVSYGFRGVRTDF